MIKRIQQLPPYIANQIAAGEVIERPASVVKELLENALDAGATTINVELGYGGLNLIQVSDNGSGILAEDLPLAVAPHATSKIEVLDDLYAINSMGFRGEALASIASVSRFRMMTKTLVVETATCLSLEEGEVVLAPCARAEGTTIEVRDLFFNVPVRKKFLKSEKQEYLAVEGVVKQFAMSAPAISLRLWHNGKQTLDLPAIPAGQSLEPRIRKLFGQEFLRDAIRIDSSRGNLRLEGWISGLGYQRSQNDRQWFYINQRRVKDRLIQHALKQVYEGLLHPGRFPSCLLYLGIDRAEVDVNVHPTKHEVRFQQPRLVHDFLRSQLSLALTAFEKPAEPIGKLARPMPAEVREPYPRSVLIGNAAAASLKADQPWRVINHQFALITEGEEVELLDLQALYFAWLEEGLQQTGFPLASRPLLLPYTYQAVDAQSSERLGKAEQFLPDLGMAFLKEGSQLRIMTIPMLLPHLDLRQFLTMLSEGVCSLGECVEALFKATQFDARQLSQEEQRFLQDYYLREKAGHRAYGRLAVRLDLKTCRQLFAWQQPKACLSALTKEDVCQD